jgi:hypothetical protein
MFHLKYTALPVVSMPVTATDRHHRQTATCL